ncbi:odorant receptor Or1-like [Zophobas morio]
MSTTELNFKALRIVGIWPRGDSGQLYKFNSYTIYAILNAITLIGLHNLSQIANIFVVYQDLAALANTCFILITNMLGVAKMCFFVRNVGNMKKLVRILNSHQFQPKTESQVKLVQPILKRWKTCYICWGSYVSFCMVLWVVGPLTVGGRMLIMPAWYPFSLEKNINYAIAYIYQAICFTYLSIGNINVDTMVYGLLMYTSTQCDLLCDNLENLDGNAEEFNMKLVNCVKHHETILSFATTANSIFNLIVLGQFATSALTIALSLFQLSLVDNLDAAAIVALFYVMGLAAQLFLYCWFGNEVETKSSKIPYSIFSSQWVDVSLHVNKNMQILVERCHRPIKITAINLFDLSLATFVTIMRTSWSYFALLHSVNSK